MGWYVGLGWVVISRLMQIGEFSLIVVISATNGLGVRCTGEHLGVLSSGSVSIRLERHFPFLRK